VFAIADSVPVIFQNHGIRVRGGIGFSVNNLDAQLGIVRDRATLADRIQTEKWPKKHRYYGFTNRKNLLDL
jgi:hypothetical protein